MKRPTARIFSTLCFIAALPMFSACGSGSDSDSGGKTNSATSPSSQTQNQGTAEGVYVGTLVGTPSGASAFDAIILENDEIWAIYGANINSTFNVYGFIHGIGESKNGSYASRDAKDFSLTTVNVSISSTYSIGAGTLAGSISAGDMKVSFSGEKAPSANYNYNTAASLSDAIGNWTVQGLQGGSLSANIAENGLLTLSGTNGCSGTGSISPRSSGKNVFGVTMTFGNSGSCNLSGQTATGIAIIYPLSATGQSQLVVMVTNSANTAGIAAFGVRNSGGQIGTPIIDSVSPAQATPGDTVTINGKNFSTTAANNIVTFNGVAATVISATTTQLRVIVPITNGGSNTVVTVSGQTGSSSTSAVFTYQSPIPRINSFSPTQARPGAMVTITGTNFSPSANNNSVLLNNAFALVTSATVTTLTVVVPNAGSGTGPIRVTVGGLTAMSTSDFAYLSPASDARWQSITAGSLHTCGVRTDGSAWCWGFNQLDFPGWPIPHQIGIDSDWVSISARDSVDCGLRISGSGWCWGSNGYGQLGIGTFSSPTRRPEEVRGTADWITLEPGSEHTCGLRTDHSIWCWGHSKFGQLGNGSSGINTFVTVPRQIGSTSDWISLSTGHSHTCGIRADGSAWCWGLNDKGQLGNGTITNATIPQQVQGGSDWISISAGAVSTCGLRLDGSAWCWGGNHYGQLGNGTTTDAAVPQPVKGRSGWRSISAGGASNCGLRTDGSAWCWGGNYYGQLGNGTTVDAAIPQRVGDHSDWISLSAGNLIHACGLRSDGSAWCWGDNSSGQLGNNSTLASSVPVPVANP